MANKLFILLIKSWLLTLFTFFALNAQADNANNEAEFQAARKAADEATVYGPKDISLLDQSTLKLPKDYGFIPKEAAAKLMKAMGNQVGSDFQGLIVGQKMQGFVSVTYEKSGYIKDEDAKHWNADDLLKNLKEGTEEGNKERAERGIPAIEVVDWVEKPNYEANHHHLVWSIATREKGASKQDDQGINYNTYVLGREGYLTLNLVTGLSVVAADKPSAHELLNAVTFNSGKRYEDFNASTDHVAEYGLAALVGGLAAKKLGLLAALGVFLLKIWKIALVGLIALGGSLSKIFGRKKEEPQPVQENS